MVRPGWVEDPFLPRAMSIYRLSVLPPDRDAGGEGHPVVEILYKVVGKGTRCLARLDPEHEVNVLGPLGNAFALPAGLELAVLVAGGIGVPPIAALASHLSEDGRLQVAGCRLQVFLGGKTQEDILCVKDFEEAGAAVHITTEDGSVGTCGLITDLLRPFLLSPPASRLAIYACGPSGMLAAVAGLAEELDLPCQASVEANMACGFGACMGCAVEVNTEESGRQYRLVCADGPVLDAREIIWR
jgi:dihydroorotate dehydrogenase electron transfer subunit